MANKQINLKAAARLVHQLGEQLISSEVVALMELIKNSYDADATVVKVNINTEEMTPYGRGKISIEDNGHGMLPSIIENSFYKLATYHKINNKFSLNFQRLSLGNKGLGRLSFQRLGYFINTTTSPDTKIFEEAKLITKEDESIIKKFNTFNLKIDWSNLEKDEELNDLKAEYNELNIPIFKAGTKIEILGLRNIKFWNLKNKDFKLLVNEIYGMANPFDESDTKDKFRIRLYIDGKYLENNEFNEEAISNLSNSIFTFKYDKKGIFKIKIEYKELYLKKYVENNILKSLEKSKFKILKSPSSYEEFQIKEYEFSINDILNNKLNPNGLSFVNNITFEMMDDKLASPGDIHGKFYFFPWDPDSRTDYTKILSSDNRFENIKTVTQLRELWNVIKGINVYRNGFRVLPYGDNDWIGFDHAAQNYKRHPFGNSNLAGYINIDGKTSENLREQTNREGFIKDEYGNNFFKLFQEIFLKTIIHDFDNFRKGFSHKIIQENDENLYFSKNKLIKFSKIVEPIEEKKAAALKIKKSHKTINKIINEVKDLPEKAKKKIELELKNSENSSIKLEKTTEMIIQAKEQDIIVKNLELAEVRNVLPMIGQSIIIEAMTHELHRIESKVREYAIESRKAIKDIEIGPKKQLDYNQSQILLEINYLKEQLFHLAPTYRGRDKLIEEINIKKFFEEMYLQDGPLKRKADSKNVNVNVLGDDLVIKINKGYLVTIFDNLFLNSLYWVEFSKGKKEITFEISPDGEVHFYDLGPGINKEVEEKLFEPFISLKENGRGLGLYIVHSLLNDSNASIGMSEERREGNKYKFAIKFNSIVEQKNLFNI